MSLSRFFLYFGSTCLLLMIGSGCSEPKSVIPGETEELERGPDKVPAHVIAAAESVCQRLGGAVIVGWYWDIEEQGWECKLHGLSRTAELDITQAGEFSEIEIVYTFDEVKTILPEVAEQMSQMLHTDEAPFVELSLRRIEHLDTLPDLKTAWSLSGIVLEFQCTSGPDFELDSKGLYLKRNKDD